MALTFKLAYTILDGNGEESTVSIPLPTTFSLSDYGEFGVAFGQLMEAIIFGRIQKAALCFGSDLSSLGGINQATASADVEYAAKFDSDTAAGRPVTWVLPAYNSQGAVSDSNEIDIANIDVAAFVDMLENGLSVTGGTITVCDIDEEDIETVFTPTQITKQTTSRWRG